MSDILMIIYGVGLGFFAKLWWGARKEAKELRETIKLHKQTIEVMQRAAETATGTAETWRGIALAHKRQIYRLLYGGKLDDSDKDRSN